MSAISVAGAGDAPDPSSASDPSDLPVDQFIDTPSPTGPSSARTTRALARRIDNPAKEQNRTGIQ